MGSQVGEFGMRRNDVEINYCHSHIDMPFFFFAILNADAMVHPITEGVDEMQEMTMQEVEAVAGGAEVSCTVRVTSDGKREVSCTVKVNT